MSRPSSAGAGGGGLGTGKAGGGKHGGGSAAAVAAAAAAAASVGSVAGSLSATPSAAVSLTSAGLPIQTPELTALFECPVCFDYVLPPILQCQAGHLVCSACRRKVSCCPTCRGPLTPSIRNLAMEKLASTLLFPCKVKKHRTRPHADGRLTVSPLNRTLWRTLYGTSRRAAQTRARPCSPVMSPENQNKQTGQPGLGGGGSVWQPGCRFLSNPKYTPCHREGYFLCEVPVINTLVWIYEHRDHRPASIYSEVKPPTPL